jgi:hypothetical protein
MQKESLLKHQTQHLHRREEEVRPYLDKPYLVSLRCKLI